jgi:hypothetical protein
MRKKLGLRLTLSVLAVGATLGAADAASSNAGREATCQLIKQAHTLKGFQRNPRMVRALRDVNDPCHEIALAKYGALAGPPTQTASAGGYGF